MNCKQHNMGEEMLENVFTRGMGLQQALNAAGELLGNPIIMFDIAYNLLAHTPCSVTDDPCWNELTTYGSFSHESVDFFLREEFIELYAKSDVVTYMHSKSLKYDRVNAKLFDCDDTQIGDINILICNNPLTERDFALIANISEIIAAELRESPLYVHIKHIFSYSPVDALLDGNADACADMPSEIQSLYGNLKKNIYVGVVDVVKYESSLTHLIYFMELFKKLQSEFQYFVYLNNVVILISIDNPILMVGKVLKKLKAFFEKYNIYAGISDCFTNLYDLQKHYKHAINALNFGMEIKNTQRIFKYDDYKLDCFLIALIDEINHNDLYNPLVPLIKQHDENRGTAYLDTVYTYLLAGANAAAAARTLNISRAELRLRLKAIAATFGMDWNDGNMLYSVFASIKLLENPPD